MEQEDNEFFILVLGVLAAIILVISWWFTAGGIATTPAVPAGSTAAASDDAANAAADHDDGDEPDSDEAADDAADHNDDAGPDDDADSGGTDNEEASSTEGDTGSPDAATVTAAAATVFDAIARDDRLGVLTDLLRTEGLDATLAAGGPFTVFAPTDDAISDAAASDTTIAVLETARPDVLEYHVVPGVYTFEELTDIARGSRSSELTTLQGETISLSLDGENVVVNGQAAISGASQTTGNGIVHTLDNVLVPPIAALNALVDIDPILFSTGSAEIDQQSFATLDRFAEVLLATAVDVTVEGHTDSSGDALRNQDLSQNRARSVVNYLVGAGVDDARLTAQGFGSTNPVADNETDEGRALNRRIEFTLN